MLYFSPFSDIMNAPALSFNKVEKVGRIIEVLRNETFCGFPVVNAKGRVSCYPHCNGSFLYCIGQ